VKNYEYQFDFDTNGIFYALGTLFGKQEWRNPAQIGQVVVSSSELANKPPSHPAWAICGRSLVRCVSMARPNMWFMADLKDKKVKLTAYTLKHYNSWDSEALRNWRFEGSNDGISWEMLKNHVNDAALNAKGATFTWKIQTESGCRAPRCAGPPVDENLSRALQTTTACSACCRRARTRTITTTLPSRVRTPAAALQRRRRV
jgi:hypothetical protein